MATPGVYAIVNTLNDRRYVGSSVDVYRRWTKHRSDLLRKRHHSSRLQEAWNLSGPDAFVFIVLDEVNDFKERLIREQLRLDETPEPYNLINSCYVRCEPGTTWSPDARRRLSSALRGKPKSPEHREALSAAMRGRKNPKHAEAIRGRTATAETREKMRVAHTGMKQSPETCAKRGAKLRGRAFTPEWKARISAAKRGKQWSQRRLDSYRAAQTSSTDLPVSMADTPAEPHNKTAVTYLQ